MVIALTGFVGASLLTGCVVRPVTVAYRSHCYHCHWHRYHRWHRSDCWVNHRGVMHCYG